MREIPHQQREYAIVLFYRYVDIEDPRALAHDVRTHARRSHLTGRAIIASEGINATFEGRTAELHAFCEWLTEDSRFAGIDLKFSPGTGAAFPKLSVKVRPEIVASHLPAEVHPTRDTGTHITPEELRSWYERGEEFVVIDMRNSYEYQAGHFRGSIDPGMENFRDLPKVLPKLEHLKHTKVVPVCTGGVRCEKASAYLKQQGFSDVYQLEGGIHRYLEAYPGEAFEGELYVFDQRKLWSPTPRASTKQVGTCSVCSGATNNIENCRFDDCPKQLCVCEECRTIAPVRAHFCSDACHTHAHASPIAA
ncbi:rhodanese-related sulfurtransferase [Patescibacteria group bacterium]|nr:rhodanese-related sulfurtransferase [Patescibacteria group bacterium]